MNIYNFINSKDVRNYLRDIHYQFTTPETAFIVYWCKHATLDKKIEAWQEIIETMPDCSMEVVQIDSFHAFLKDYIALQRQDIQNFYAGNGYIYSYEWHKTENGWYGWDWYYDDWSSDGWYGKFDLFFPDYISCMENCTKNLAKTDVDRIRIFKYPFGGNAGEECIFLNYKMEIMGIKVTHEREYDIDLAGKFNRMHFDFPTPFKRGDILAHYTVHNISRRRRPFVLSYIDTWDSKEMMNRGFGEWECPWLYGTWEHFDTWRIRDMKAKGIAIDEEKGILDTSYTSVIPIDLKYYREPLKGIERQLNVISLYEKGKIDALSLINCCSAIRLEEYSKEANRYIHRYDELVNGKGGFGGS